MSFISLVMILSYLVSTVTTIDTSYHGHTYSAESCTCLYSLWCIRHGKADEVATGHREETHDEGERGIVGEVDGKVGATLDITEHQQRDEQHPGDNQCREQIRLFTRLQRRGEEMK